MAKIFCNFVINSNDEHILHIFDSLSTFNPSLLNFLLVDQFLEVLSNCLLLDLERLVLLLLVFELDVGEHDVLLAGLGYHVLRAPEGIDQGLVLLVHVVEVDLHVLFLVAGVLGLFVQEEVVEDLLSHLIELFLPPELFLADVDIFNAVLLLVSLLAAAAFVLFGVAAAVTLAIFALRAEVVGVLHELLRVVHFEIHES